VGRFVLSATGRLKILTDAHRAIARRPLV